MEVGEIMTESPEYIGPDATVRDVVERFMELDIRHLPVVENGEVVGMVSDRDLRNHLLPVSGDAEDRLDAPVRDVMHSGALTVTPDTNVAEVIDVMIENKIGAVPVVDNHENSLCGILSYVDILRATRDLLEE